MLLLHQGWLGSCARPLAQHYNRLFRQPMHRRCALAVHSAAMFLQPPVLVRCSKPPKTCRLRCCAGSLAVFCCAMLCLVAFASTNPCASVEILLEISLVVGRRHRCLARRRAALAYAFVCCTYKRIAVPDHITRSIHLCTPAVHNRTRKTPSLGIRGYRLPWAHPSLPATTLAATGKRLHSQKSPLDPSTNILYHTAQPP